jgi:DNA-binding transcriptional regulator LsrR (DeoR family)
MNYPSPAFTQRDIAAELSIAAATVNRYLRINGI